MLGQLIQIQHWLKLSILSSRRARDFAERSIHKHFACIDAIGHLAELTTFADHANQEIGKFSPIHRVFTDVGSETFGTSTWVWRRAARLPDSGDELRRRVRGGVFR